MSDTDSFIEEVTEELRRDRLFALLRKYGWIAVLLVVVLVGGAAVREYLLSRERAAAEARGDAILAALDIEDADERAAALAAIPAEGKAAALIAMMAADAELGREDQAAAAQLLESIALDGDLPARYRDLAALKRVMILSQDLPAEERKAQLTGLAAPGAPYRVLAEEQLALIEAEQGDSDAALARLQQLLDDQEATSGLRRRISDMIVALGGTLDQAN